MIAFALKHWKPLASAGIALLLVVGFNVWLSAAKSAAYERGYAAADMECRNAREAAQRARDAQLETIRKQEADKRAELEAKLAAERAENADLDRRVTEANQRAERARRDAERRIDEALSIDGYAGCTSTERVSDGLRDDLSAYRTRHGN